MLRLRLRSFLPAVVLALGAGYALTPVALSAPEPTPAPDPAPAAPFNQLGRADAPVTMLEFSDLQCQFCARHASQTFPQLRRDYIETGKLRYVAHDMPLSYHPYAMPAAVAGRCAGEQGRFWEYRAALFEAQARLAQEPYVEVATTLGLDLERFEACRRDGRHEAAIRADLALAASLGLDSTPSFVISRTAEGKPTGDAISGAKPIAVFTGRIDALLAAPP
jgi:protein-disulfide isomerase